MAGGNYRYAVLLQGRHLVASEIPAERVREPIDGGIGLRGPGVSDSASLFGSIIPRDFGGRPTEDKFTAAVSGIRMREPSRSGGNRNSGSRAMQQNQRGMRT
jgi:hypothetical protein